MEIKFKGTEYDYFGKFVKYLRNKSRYLVLYGSAGSGKSQFAAQKILSRVLYEEKHRFLIVRKTRPSLRKSCFTLIGDKINDWGLSSLFYINKTDMMYEFKNNGNQILFVGMDDEEKLKSIERITGIWIEEPNEISEREFMQIDLRLRGKTENYKQIILTFNPISELLWLYKIFFEGKKENCTIGHSTVDDNIFIDSEYKNILDALKDEDEIFYKIYRLGEWGTLGEAIYTKYEFADEQFDNFDELIYGLDFGYNHPSTLLEIRFQDTVSCERELLYKTKLTNEDLILELEKLIANKNDIIYADCAEPARIEEIRRVGFNIHPANKNVKDGIDYCRRLNPKITKDSVNLIKEIGRYSYKKDKNGNVLDEPVKFMDHLMDARRYAYYTHFKKSTHAYIERFDPKPELQRRRW